MLRPIKHPQTASIPTISKSPSLGLRDERALLLLRLESLLPPSLESLPPIRPIPRVNAKSTNRGAIDKLYRWHFGVLSSFWDAERILDGGEGRGAGGFHSNRRYHAFNVIALPAALVSPRFLFFYLSSLSFCFFFRFLLLAVDAIIVVFDFGNVKRSLLCFSRAFGDLPTPPSSGRDLPCSPVRRPRQAAPNTTSHPIYDVHPPRPSQLRHAPTTTIAMSLRPAHRILLRAAAARPLIAAPRIFVAAQQRWNSSSDIPEPANTRPSKPLTQAPANAGPAATPLEQPSYQLTFTCRPCQTRSTHNVTKQAYHGGTVLIQCPGCKNRHVIADHLKVSPPPPPPWRVGEWLTRFL
jgi:hypothetical protein